MGSCEIDNCTLHTFSLNRSQTHQPFLLHPAVASHFVVVNRSLLFTTGSMLRRAAARTNQPLNPNPTTPLCGRRRVDFHPFGGAYNEREGAGWGDMWVTLTLPSPSLLPTPPPPPTRNTNGSSSSMQQLNALRSLDADLLPRTTCLLPTAAGGRCIYASICLSSLIGGDGLPTHSPSTSHPHLNPSDHRSSSPRESFARATEHQQPLSSHPHTLR